MVCSFVLSFLFLHQATAQSDNLLLNPGFESGTGSWTFYTDGSGNFASVSPGFAGTRAARLTLNSGGANIQLFQSNIRLESNTSYTLTFAAYSNTSHPLALFIHKQVSPFTSFGLNNRVVNLTNSWQTYTVQFTTSGFTGAVTDARLRIWLSPYAAAGDLYYLDDIELRKTESAPVAPSITSHPASVSMAEGQTVTFSVSATGSVPLTYQWQRNNVNIAGANGSSYVTPPVATGENGATFRCVVTNAAGSATSNEATLTVIPAPPAILTHPASVTVVEGQTVIFSVSAAGTQPLAYQWQRNSLDIPGATGATLTTSPASLADNGALFRCVVMNDLGNVASNSATLTVTPASPSSPNLIANPGFESGTSSWTFYTDGTGSFASVSPGFNGTRAARLLFNSGGSNIQLFQSNIRLEPNTGYTLTFAAYSTTSRPFSIFLHKQVSPFTNYGINNRVVNLTSAWQTYSIQFTTIGFAGVVTDARIRLWFVPYAQSGDMLFLDDIELRKTATDPVPPVITSHPVDISVSEGQSPAFAVSATGTAPLMFQWQRNNLDIPGASGSTYTAPPATSVDDGATFRCIVTNSTGSATSNPATLTVLPSPPSILGQPSSIALQQGQTATFTVLGAGTPPLSYQWQRNAQDIAGANGASYTTDPVSLTDIGALFRCIISNGLGSVASNAAVLTLVIPPSITSQPFHQTVNAGQPAIFSVSASGSPLSFQWKRNGVDIGGATGASYTLSAATLSDNGAMFTCVVANSAGSITSDAAALTVLPAPTSSPNIILNPGFESGTGSWTFYTDGTGNYASVSPGFSGARAGRLTLNTGGSNIQLFQSNITLEPNTSYTLSFAAYCNTAHSISVFLHKQVSPFTNYGVNGRVFNLTGSWQTYSVQFTTTGFSGVVSDARIRFWLVPYGTAGDVYYIDDVELRKTATPPTILVQPPSLVIPEGQSATFSVTAAGTPPLSYQWQRNGTSIQGATSSSFTLPAVIGADSGSVFRCIISNESGSVVTGTAILTVVPSPPVMVQHPTDRMVLLGQNAMFSVVAAGTPLLTYQWERNTVPIQGATSPTYTTGAAVPGDDGALFRCVVSNGLGNITSNAAALVIGVPPQVVVHPTSQTVNDGQAVMFSISAAGTAPLFFQWLRDGVPIQGASGSAYSIMNTSMQDSGIAFRCVVMNGVGSDTSNPASLAVNGVRPTITIQPVGQLIAEGQSALFSVSAIGTGILNYQWQKNGVNIAGTAGSSYTTPVATIADSGAAFRCIVGNYKGADTSNGVVLRVTRNIAIQVWYGKNQVFGASGDPVPDINILGNVRSSQGMMALHYGLNGGAFKPLSTGPDTRRLVGKGDFNIDIPFSTLLQGANQVVIRARDSMNVLAFDTVVVHYAAGNTWPVSYDIDWLTAGSIQDVAQVLDGLWSVDAATSTLRPAQLGYDRLVAVGEHSWTDYEVTVPVVIHRIDSSGFASPSNGPAIGFLMRWPGHSNSPASTSGWQPKTGYLPLGALVWYHYAAGSERFVIVGNNLATLATDNSGRTLARGVRYIFKARVETMQTGAARYRLKVWADSLSEPADWTLTGQASVSDPQQGSLLLVAHHVDASFGNIMVRPVGTSQMLPLAGLGTEDSLSGPAEDVPASFALNPNYPNPFNPFTTIVFDIPEQALVTLKVYDVLGREIETLSEGERIAGRYPVVWNGTNRNGDQVASGVYFYRIVASGSSGQVFVEQNRMMLLR